MLANRLFTATVLTITLQPAASQAANEILTSIDKQGHHVMRLSDEKLRDIKGAALVIGQPLPSVTQGSKTFNVSWLGFGSQADYRKYRYVGFAYSPQENQQFNHGGIVYTVAGYTWMADISGNPNQWCRFWQISSIA
ncbi:hypothetical protein ACIP02_17295 [Pseudomonas sp. NPDC089408]|uniref:hypothetical protein n=1 Tax=Pseudomonas sp. NPDC089408 TaxID=3364465 RepID=UPI00382D8267